MEKKNTSTIPKKAKLREIVFPLPQFTSLSVVPHQPQTNPLVLSPKFLYAGEGACNNVNHDEELIPASYSPSLRFSIRPRDPSSSASNISDRKTSTVGGASSLNSSNGPTTTSLRSRTKGIALRRAVRRRRCTRRVRQHPSSHKQSNTVKRSAPVSADFCRMASRMHSVVPLKAPLMAATKSSSTMFTMFLCSLPYIDKTPSDLWI